MTTHILAMKHSAVRDWETGIIRRGSFSMYIQVAWLYDSAYWTFLTTTQKFAAWVDDGFPVCCIMCLYKTDECEHVIFAGDRSKAHREATVITMGLV